MIQVAAPDVGEHLELTARALVRRGRPHRPEHPAIGRVHARADVVADVVPVRPHHRLHSLLIQPALL